jgi:hypothetical protein
MKLLIMKSSPSLLSSFLLGLNIFFGTLFSDTLLSLFSSVVYMYCPICMQLSLKDLRTVFLSLFELRENERRESPTFFTCVSEIISVPVPSDRIAF